MFMCVHVCVCHVCEYECVLVLTDLSTAAVTDSKDIEIVLIWWYDHGG